MKTFFKKTIALFALAIFASTGIFSTAKAEINSQSSYSPLAVFNSTMKPKGLWGLDMTAGGDITLKNSTSAIKSGDYPVYLKSGITSVDQNTTGHIFDTTNDLIGNDIYYTVGGRYYGSKIASWKNLGTEVMYLTSSDNYVGDMIPGLVINGKLALGDGILDKNAFLNISATINPAPISMTPAINLDLTVDGTNVIPNPTGINAAMTITRSGVSPYPTGFNSTITQNSTTEVFLAKGYTFWYTANPGTAGAAKVAGFMINPPATNNINITDFIGFYSPKQGGAGIVNNYGMQFEKQYGAINNYALAIIGDGDGADISLGEAKDAQIKFTGASLQLDAQRVSNLDDITLLGDVSVGNKATVGTNLVTNGTFASDTSWTKATGWTISGGLGRHSSSGAGALSQTIKIFDGSLYKVTYTITNNASSIDSGYISLGGSKSEFRYIPGTYTDYIRAGSTNSLIEVFPTATTARFEIDNISVQLVTSGDLSVMGNISVGGAGVGTLGGTGLQGQITGNIDTGASTMVDFALRRAENTTATLGSQVYLGRQRGTLGTAGTVVTGDNLLTLNAYGHDGTDYVISSQILADVEGTVAANQLPGRLIFKTANSAGTLTEALRIDSNQNITQSNGLFFPIQRTTANAPAYVKGGMYFDTTLNKLMIGGATAWEAVTSI